MCINKRVHNWIKSELFVYPKISYVVYMCNLYRRIKKIHNLITFSIILFSFKNTTYANVALRCAFLQFIETVKYFLVLKIKKLVFYIRLKTTHYIHNILTDLVIFTKIRPVFSEKKSFGLKLHFTICIANILRTFFYISVIFIYIPIYLYTPHVTIVLIYYNNQ